MGVRTFPQRKQEARRPEPKSPHDHAPDDFSILPPGARPRHDSRPAQEPEQEPSNARSLFAEFFGTAALTTVAAGGEVIASISNGEVSHDARAIAPVCSSWR